MSFIVCCVIMKSHCQEVQTLFFRSMNTIIQVDKHLGCAFSGLTADAKMLIDRARVESRNHWFSHDRLMPVESIAQVLKSLSISFSFLEIHLGCIEIGSTELDGSLW